MSIDAPTPGAFLYGWIDTDIPGGRKITVGGSPRTVAAGYRRFPDWITAVDTAITTAGLNVSWSTSTGLVTWAPGGGVAVVWDDRLGELCGMDRRPGFAETLTGVPTSALVPPGAVWLVGAQWVEITTARERVAEEYRWRRGRGYVWGGARVWEWELVMHHDAFVALEYGWVTAGKVSLWAGENAAIGSGQSDGQLDGYVIGIQEPERVGPTDDFVRIRLAMSESI